MCMSAAAVLSCKAVLSFTWQRCIGLSIPSTELLQSLSDVPVVWCILHVQLCQTETALVVTQQKKKSTGGWCCSADHVKCRNRGQWIKHRMTFLFNILGSILWISIISEPNHGKNESALTNTSVPNTFFIFTYRLSPSLKRMLYTSCNISHITRLSLISWLFIHVLWITTAIFRINAHGL